MLLDGGGDGEDGYGSESENIYVVTKVVMVRKTMVESGGGDDHVVVMVGK